MSKNDPYHDRKVVHKANKINEKGQASALCSNPPRAINMKVATWVIAPENDSAVTCKKCLKLMRTLLEREQDDDRAAETRIQEPNQEGL